MRFHFHQFTKEVERVKGWKYPSVYGGVFTLEPRKEEEKTTKIIKRCSVCQKPKVFWLYGHQSNYPPYVIKQQQE
jgi:hypothetical protein